jgi:serine/threonine protein phosphatase 1
MSQIVAVGDIHGCHIELLDLMNHINFYVKGPRKLIFIGDYVDRGPHQVAVIRYLMDLQKHEDAICLFGNHEQMLLVEDRYFERTGQEAIIFEKYADWLRSLPLYYVDDMGRIYVHAGIDRDKSITQQDSGTMLWTREEFYRDVREDGGFVVHGHTPHPNRLPAVYNNRCNLDTGAVFGGTLSCAVFDNSQIKPKMLINHKGFILKDIDWDNVNTGTS